MWRHMHIPHEHCLRKAAISNGRCVGTHDVRGGYASPEAEKTPACKRMRIIGRDSPHLVWFPTIISYTNNGCWACARQVHCKIAWEETVHVFPCAGVCLQEPGNDTKESVDGQEEKSGPLSSNKTRQTVRWVLAVVRGALGLEAVPLPT